MSNKSSVAYFFSTQDIEKKFIVFNTIEIYSSITDEIGTYFFIITPSKNSVFTVDDSVPSAPSITSSGKDVLTSAGNFYVYSVYYSYKTKKSVSVIYNENYPFKINSYDHLEISIVYSYFKTKEYYLIQIESVVRSNINNEGVIQIEEIVF